MRASFAGRCFWGLLSVLPLALAASPGLASVYVIDQRFGEITFSVSHMGLFTSEGRFRRFGGNLSIDPAHPEQTQIAVDVDATSVAMSSQDAVVKLESAAFFDAQRHPDIRFTSSQVVPVGRDHYVIRGALTIRGVTQPQELDAVLVGRHFDPSWHANVGDFVVTGRLRRSLFGMTSDRTFISGAVAIKIQAHLRLDESPP
jgi:polyisoprenoid-binding protein YceI